MKRYGKCNVLITVYYSLYLILFGQILIGTAAARMTSSIGKIARDSKLTQKVGLLGVLTVLGSVSGPNTIFLIQYVEYLYRKLEMECWEYGEDCND